MATYDETTGEIVLSTGERLMSEGHQSDDEPWEAFEQTMQGYEMIESEGYRSALIFAVAVDAAYLPRIEADED